MGLLDLAHFVRDPALEMIRLNPPPNQSTEEAVRLLLPGAPALAELTETLRELQLDHDFYNEVNERFVKTRGRRCAFERWTEFLYVLVRTLRPETVVLTGVFDGAADAVILRAMERNRHGRLISIDLPAKGSILHSTSSMKDSSLPPGKDPGWLVPDRLLSHYDLRLGDSRQLLPAALGELSEIDLFLHDSLHTYDHQTFEYTAAWPRLREGGLLLSDDVFWNMAFWRFIRKVKRQPVIVDSVGCVRK